MANTTDRDLNREFLKGVKAAQWREVDPQPVPTRESLKRDLREHLIQKSGSAALADLSISHLEHEATARAHLETQLRQDLARIDAAIQAFGRETTKVMAPHEARLKAAQAEFERAGATFEAARAARYSELSRTLGAKRDRILAELRGVDVPFGRLVGWREGGDVPQFPPGTR